MLFNQNFNTYYCKKKLHLNILIFHGDTKVIQDFWDILYSNNLLLLFYF